MKLYFDANQVYQLEAIQSVVDLFEGQPFNGGDFEFSLSDDLSLNLNENGFGNNLVISQEQILANLAEVQNRNNVPESSELLKLKYKLKKENESEKEVIENFPNFSLEMETGTGKTYVYLRTIYELNKAYGFKKFVIVVPSIAIKEGVIKNLEITREHFQNIYDKTPAYFDVYDSKKVSALRGFASSNNIQILVINIDSFAKDTNIINQPKDKLTGKKPIEFIQSSFPVVIVDEPQNMETDIRKAALANLNPLCTLRYSATHKFVYNLIYKLDPVKAYDLGLVKQIEVDSVIALNAFNQPFAQLENIIVKPKIKAKIKIDCNTDEGVKHKLVNAKTGNDLFDLSNKREIYRDGYIINEIDSISGSVEFSGGLKLNIGESTGGLNDDIMREQIKSAVKEHFAKEKQYKELGIKVLSLFFIDRVSNYRSYGEDGKTIKGKFALWFEEAYKEETSKQPGVIPFTAEEVHNGYFAQDKKGHFKDTKKGESEDDDKAYKLIMKDKERLLDINVPLRFIYSHSALREGWDNPNVFQICTLNETQSDMKKRQEIGRGLRLAVNQQGLRTFDKNINRLTVIANESYEDFANRLQNEIQEDCGVEFKDRVKDKRTRVNVKLKKKYRDDKKFLELWDKIKHKTIYNVSYSTEKLIELASGAISKMQSVKRALILIDRSKLDITEKGISTVSTGTRVTTTNENNQFIPDLISYIQSKTELTRNTIVQILKKSGRLNDVLINPQMFLDFVVAEIKSVLDELLVDGIKYQKIAGLVYEMTLFEDGEIVAYKQNLLKVKNEVKTLYNYIDFQSEIEEQFAIDCENNDNIDFYIKLPRGFTIDTPLGPYNPDWALIYKDESKIYFVAETKGSLLKSNLRNKEVMKIECGEKHFNEFEDVMFKKVTKVSELLI